MDEVRARCGYFVIDTTTAGQLGDPSLGSSLECKEGDEVALVGVECLTIASVRLSPPVSPSSDHPPSLRPTRVANTTCAFFVLQAEIFDVEDDRVFRVLFTAIGSNVR